MDMPATLEVLQPNLYITGEQQLEVFLCEDESHILAHHAMEAHDAHVLRGTTSMTST